MTIDITYAIPQIVLVCDDVFAYCPTCAESSAFKDKHTVSTRVAANQVVFERCDNCHVNFTTGTVTVRDDETMVKMLTPKMRQRMANTLIEMKENNTPRCRCEHGHITCASFSDGPCAEELFELHPESK